ncbi:MAG: N-acetyltransferase [Bacteroidales bacterium]|nr:N-acetyltransferase [Bacteroidales bacterium]
MSVDIVTVKSRSQLRDFIQFPDRLYKDCENWVPALQGDEYDTFDPGKNGAYDFCESECFLAYKDGKLAGRVAAIINHKADDEGRIVRFGWLDFVGDKEVLEALIDTVAEWGKARDRVEIRGPWGFTDMDKEGLLTDGFEYLSPFTCIYNYPYYCTMLEELGFEKDVDWTQRILEIPPQLPSMFQYNSLIEQRFGVRAVVPESMAQMNKRYGMEIFHLYNEAFAPLHGFSPLTDKQIKNYLKTYVPILDKDFISVVVNSDDKPVGFLFCVPTLSKAIKKARGKLFPFGFIHILKALKKNDTLEALLIGVLPEYQSCGVPALMFKQLHEGCLRRGIKHIIMNPQLEDNYKVQSLFGAYEVRPYMRRRAYRKAIL